MPRAARVRISPWSSARIAPPTAVPSISLAGKVHRTRLADDHDFDLPRVLELALDLARDQLGELARLAVVDRVGRHDHAHLPTGLDREHLLDPRELRRNLFELREPLDVRLERLSSRAGTGPGDGVGGLHDDADGRLVRRVVVVRGDAVDHRRMLAVLGRDFHAQLDVRAIMLVRENLADVMQQRAAFGELGVELQLGGDDPRKPGDFLRMLEDVLPVRRAVAHPADELHELRVHPLDARLVHRLLAGLDDRRFDLDARLLDHFLDAARVDAPVGDQSLQREATHLAAYGVEARDHDRVGRVVDDDIDAGGGFEGPDIPPLTADDAALHFVGREGHGRDGGFGRGFGREPLNGQGEGFLCFLVRSLAGLLLQVAREGRGLVPGFVLQAAQQLLLRFLCREAGDLLEPRARFELDGRERTLALREGTPATVERPLPLVQAALPLLQRLLTPLAFPPPAREILLKRLARLDKFFLGRQHHALTCIREQPLAFRRRRPGGRFRDPSLHPPSRCIERQPRGHATSREGRENCQPVRHRIYLQHHSAGGGASILAYIWPTTAFRLPGGRSLVRSSASAASRAATSRSPFLAWNSSFVMSSAARMAALCVSTMGPWESTFFNAWSTYAATSRVYSGGRSDRTVYSSPPIMTLTACFLVLTGPPLLPPPLPVHCPHRRPKRRSRPPPPPPPLSPSYPKLILQRRKTPLLERDHVRLA